MANIVRHFRSNSLPGSPSLGSIHYVPIGSDEYVQYVTDNSGNPRLPAVLAHEHDISDVDGLQTALDAKLSQITADGRYVSLGNYGSASQSVSAYDLHTLAHTGIFYTPSPSNRPSGSSNGFVFSAAYGSAAAVLFVDQTVDGGIWLRRKTGGSWQTDRKLATEYWVGNQSFATQSWATANFAPISHTHSEYVPASRTITINGLTFDLTANRSWTFTAANLTPGTGLSGSTYNGSTAQEWSLNTTWLNNNYVNTSGNQSSLAGVKAWTGQHRWTLASNASPVAEASSIQFARGATGIYMTAYDLDAVQSFIFRTGEASGIQLTLQKGGIATPNHGNSSQWSSAYTWVNTYGSGLQSGPYVPASRTITINGVTLDLSSNRSWTVSQANLSAGTGLTGDTYNGSTARTWSIDTVWLSNNYVDLSSNQTAIAGQKAWTGQHRWSLTGTVAPVASADTIQVARGSTGIYLTGHDPESTQSFILRTGEASGYQLTLSKGGVTTPNHGNSSQWNSAYSWVNSTGASLASGGPYVPASRTITINGTTLDLSANRSWTVSISTLTAGNGISGTSFNGTSNQTWSLDTNWLNNRYVNNSTEQTGIAGVKQWTGQNRWTLTSNVTPVASSDTMQYARGGTGIYLTGYDPDAIQAFILRTGEASGIQLTLYKGGVSTSNHGNSSQWNSAYNWVNTYGSGLQSGPYVPASRTITINGNTLDLSANRSWTVTMATLTRGTGLTGSNYNGGSATTWAIDFGTGENQVARGNHTHSNYVPTSRTITINGTSFDLSANRSWTINAVTGAGSGNSGYLAIWNSSSDLTTSMIRQNGGLVTVEANLRVDNYLAVYGSTSNFYGDVSFSAHAGFSGTAAFSNTVNMSGSTNIGNLRIGGMRTTSVTLASSPSATSVDTTLYNVIRMSYSSNGAGIQLTGTPQDGTPVFLISENDVNSFTIRNTVRGSSGVTFPGGTCVILIRVGGYWYIVGTHDNNW